MYTICYISSLTLSATLAVGLSLNVTSLSAANGASTLECWQMDTPLSISTQAGTSGAASVGLGDVANISYTVIPAGYDGGTHNAPYNQWVAFISGLAHITLPANETGEAFISGGEFGLIFVADTAGVSKLGHRTQYPGVTETIGLSIPARDNVIPAHEVLHAGPCTGTETGGIRELATGDS